MHLDVVPVHQLPRDVFVGVRIGLGDADHRRVREHDAESERVAGAIALDDPNAMARVGLLHQQSEKYRPPGPPPTQTMSSGHGVTLSRLVRAASSASAMIRR